MRLTTWIASVLCCIFSGIPVSLFAETGETESINIWPQGAVVEGDQREEVAVPVHVFLPDADKATGQGVVICPGGGYAGLCMGPEGYGIAKWLNANGIAGFVLEYRLPKGRPYVPMNDAARAIRTIRANADHFGVRTNAIGIIGFSAGGHLASTAATHFDAGTPDAADPVERFSSRPDFAILIYPVVSFGRNPHSATRQNLLGDRVSPELIDLFSNEKQVSDETPPCFLAHATDDQVVSISNSEDFVQAMKEHNRPAVLWSLPDGGHGLNGYKGSSWDKWQSECIKWLGTL